MPIIGITASSITASTLGNFDSIATTTVGAGGSSSVTFSNIPSTYKHLQLRILAKNGTNGGDATAILGQFNSDTTYTNYIRHILYGDGSSVAAASNQSSAFTGAQVGLMSTNAGTSMFGVSITDILDYTSTNKNKTVKSLNGWDTNNQGYVIFSSALWLSTSAITSITLVPYVNTFGQYTTFALYGIK